MTNGEIIALLLSFCALIVSFVFSLRKDGRESANATKQDAATLATIQIELRNITANTERIEKKVDQIEQRSNGDHEKIIENDTKIKNLEKEVFRKGA